MPVPVLAKWTNIDGTDVFRSQEINAIAYRCDHVSIDADGAPNAYNPENTGLDDLANAGYPHKSWWKDVLAEDPMRSNFPYVQREPAKYPGFFVAKTSLRNPDPLVPDTSTEKYVDATRVPYIVYTSDFYKASGTGHLGDFVFVASETSSSWAILADTGGHVLGEISISLASKLSGGPVNARNAEGAPRAPLSFIAFLNTAHFLKWPISDVQIQTVGDELSAKIGGSEALLALCRGF